MNVLEAFSQANRGVPKEQIKVQPTFNEAMAARPVPGATMSAANINTEGCGCGCEGDFDSAIISVVHKLKRLMKEYDLDEEDHEKISSSSMKLEGMLPDGLPPVIQTSAPQQQTPMPGPKVVSVPDNGFGMSEVPMTDVNAYLGRM
jgi:hypothetical protein